MFEELDKPALLPLPKDGMELFETQEIRSIPANYLVEYEGFSYSVPYKYIGKRAYLHAYKNKIIVVTDTREVIATHPRHYKGSRTVIKLEHMPENHRAFYEFQHTNGDDYRKKALGLGKYVHTFICDMLTTLSLVVVQTKSSSSILFFVYLTFNSFNKYSTSLL